MSLPLFKYNYNKINTQLQILNVNITIYKLYCHTIPSGQLLASPPKEFLTFLPL